MAFGIGFGFGVAEAQILGGGSATPAPVLTLAGYDIEEEEIQFSTEGAFASATLFWAVSDVAYATGAAVVAAAGADASGSFAITQSDTAGTIDLSALAPEDYELSAVVRMPDGSFSNVETDTVTLPSFGYPTGVEWGTHIRSQGSTATFGAASEGDLKLLLVADENATQMALPTGWTRSLHRAQGNVSLNIFSKQVGVGGEGADNFVFTPNGGNWCWAEVILRPDTGGALEVNPTIVTSGGSGNNHFGPTLPDAAANSLVITVAALDNGGSTGAYTLAAGNPAAPFDEAVLWNNSSFGDLVSVQMIILRDQGSAPTPARRFDTFSNPTHANATFEVRYV